MISINAINTIITWNENEFAQFRSTYVIFLLFVN